MKVGMVARGVCETVYNGMSSSASLDLKGVRFNTRAHSMSDGGLHE